MLHEIHNTASCQDNHQDSHQPQAAVPLRRAAAWFHLFAAECADKINAACIAIRWLLRKSRHQRCVRISWNPSNRFRHSFQNGFHQNSHVIAFERNMARKHLVCHHRQRILVRRLALLQAGLPLFGGFVQVRARTGERFIGKMRHAGANLRRQTEIQHLHRPVRRNLHVVGLDVAMDDALPVRGVQCLRDLPQDGQRRLQRQRPLAPLFPHPAAEAVAFHVVHDEIIVPRVHVPLQCLASGDVRVGQFRDKGVVVPHVLHLSGVVGDFRRQALDRNFRIANCVKAFIDDAHAALPDLRLNFVPIQDHVTCPETTAWRRCTDRTGAVVVIMGMVCRLEIAVRRMVRRLAIIFQGIHGGILILPSCSEIESQQTCRIISCILKILQIRSPKHKRKIADFLCNAIHTDVFNPCTT